MAEPRTPRAADEDLARFRSIGDTEIPLYTGALCLLDGEVSFEALAARVMERAAGVPALARALEGSVLPRVPARPAAGSRFDPGALVRRTTVAPPGGRCELRTALAELWSRPLAAGSPRWQVTLLDGLKRGQTAIVVKAHRSLADESSGLDLADLLLGEDAPASPYDPRRTAARLPTRRPAPPPGALAVAGSLARPIVARTLQLARGATELIEPRKALARARDLALWLESTSLVVSTPAPETPFNGAVGGPSRIGWVRVARDVLAGIEDVLGATREEIVLLILADALGRHLEARGRHTLALELTAIVKPAAGPFAARAPAGALLGLPVGALSPRERHAAIHAALADDSARDRLRSLEALVDLCLKLPAGPRGVTAQIAYQAVNTLCVRARRPRPSREIAGQRPLLAVPIAPLPWNVGLGFAWAEAGDEVALGIAADARLVPCLKAVEDAVRAAYVDTAASAGVPALDPERRARAARAG